MTVEQLVQMLTSGWQILIVLLPLAVSVGGYIVGYKLLRQQVNGLGTSHRTFVKNVIALLTEWADTDEKRKQVADLLRGK